MEPTRGYEGYARGIAASMGLVVKAAYKGRKCPKWESPCRHAHGDHYRVTLHFTGRVTGHESRGSVSFDFWNSQRDAMEGKRPGYYDILSTVASDATMPTNPDDVTEEFGAMRPLQALAIAKFAKRLKTFFTQTELDALAEIQ